MQVLNNTIDDLKKNMSDQINKLAEQNKTIVKIQSIKNGQSKKINDLKTILLGLLLF